MSLVPETVKWFTVKSSLNTAGKSSPFKRIGDRTKKVYIFCENVDFRE